MRKGIPVSPGVAVGTAYCIQEIFVNPDTKRLEDNEITAELANYETARDRALTNKVRGWIVNDRLDSQSALGRLLDEYTVLFSRTSDEYLKERLNDLRDVVVRVSAHLSTHSAPDGAPLTGPIILVTDEL